MNPSNSRALYQVASANSFPQGAHCPQCLDGFLLRTQSEKIAELLNALEVRQGMSRLENERLRSERDAFRGNVADDSVPTESAGVLDRPPVAATCPLLQLFWDTGAGYSETNSTVVPIQPGDLHTYKVLVPKAGLERALRLDVGDLPGFYRLTALEVTSLKGKLWRAAGQNLGSLCTIAGTGEALTCSDGLALWSEGCDPQVYFTVPRSPRGGATFLSFSLQFKSHVPATKLQPLSTLRSGTREIVMTGLRYVVRKLRSQSGSSAHATEAPARPTA